MNPDDIAWAVDDILSLSLMSDDGVFIFDARSWHRAAAQSYAAREIGAAFPDVRCTRVYIRMFTRQELWTDYGRDRFFEARLFQCGYGYYFKSAGYGEEGWYCDITHRRIASAEIEKLRATAMVPGDWKPTSDMPAFCWVTADHPRAIPAWHVERW